MDISGITTTFEQARNAAGLVRQIMSIGVQKELADALGRVRTALHDVMELEETVFAIKRENEELRAQLEEQARRYTQWQDEKASYHLEEVWPGTFAYAFRGGADSTKPLHYLCAQCFEKGQKGYLQRKPDIFDALGQATFKCSNCESETVKKE